MAERKFTRALSKPGSAAQVRETVSQAVRESTVLAKPHLVEPLDYETFILKSRTILQNDPQRELLLFPLDDFSQSAIPRTHRTMIPTIPEGVNQLELPLFVRECIASYCCDWHIINYNYDAYSGSYLQLPRLPKSTDLQDQVYEVDADAETKEKIASSNSSVVIKEGYVMKGPESGADSFITVATKFFKKRYMSLRKEVDGTYMLEFYKDDSKTESKGTICMEFCTGVGRNIKRGKHNFELQMGSGQKSCTLFTEKDVEMEEWISCLNSVIVDGRNSIEASRKRPPSFDDGEEADKVPSSVLNIYGTLRSLEQSKNPELMKYARETDYSIAQARKENRQNLFSVYPEMQRLTLPQPSFVHGFGPEPYKERFGMQFMVKCEEIKFHLKAPLEGEKGVLCQVEPFMTSMALFDVKKGKVSEEFHFDINLPAIRSILLRRKSENNARDKSETEPVSNIIPVPEFLGFSEEWFAFPKQAIFTVQHPSPDLYLVIRIEKVLQGGIASAAEPYIRQGIGSMDNRLGQKTQKFMRACCQRLGHYRMPFAWAARPVFKHLTRELDTSSEFGPIYRQDGNRLSDEDILKFLADLKRPDKLKHMTVIPGSIRMTIQYYKETVPNSFTPSLLPVVPFPVPPTHEPTFEIQEFPAAKATDSYPFTIYLNHLYVYPKSLKYESQKTFAKARNIACSIEFKESDEEGSKPLKCIYGRPGESKFTYQASSSVCHHNSSPDFYEEVKLVLPLRIHDRHHLLFTFYHVSCELPKGGRRKDLPVEMAVGYSWFPLLNNDKLTLGEQMLPVASHLPSGYLSCKPFGLGKGYGGPEIRWADGGKSLFKVNLKLVSTVYTEDQYLQSFFVHCEKLLENKLPDLEMDTNLLLKALHSINVSTIIQFLPTVFNQLFHLLVFTSGDDVSLNTVHVLIHFVHSIHEVGKDELLQSYVKFVFRTVVDASQRNTVHEELAKSVTATLRPANTDFLVITKLLHHCWFFFEIIVKSMAQYLLHTERVKMHRHERFPADYQFRIQSLLQSLMPHLLQKYRDIPIETRRANESIAHFLKRCLTLMDRGFVFKLIKLYLENFNPGDARVLQEYKFEFLCNVCSHEHFIALNLPLQRSVVVRSHIKQMRDYHECYLTEEFCHSHFLIGILLQEVKAALSEVPEIRLMAIRVLRNLLAKHTFDDRFQGKVHQARMASLYLPFISILLENINRLNVSGCSLPSSPASPEAEKLTGSFPSMPFQSPSPQGTPLICSRRNTFADESTSQSAPSSTQHTRDSSYLQLIAGKEVQTGGFSRNLTKLSSQERKTCIREDRAWQSNSLDIGIERKRFDSISASFRHPSVNFAESSCCTSESRSSTPLNHSDQWNDGGSNGREDSVDGNKDSDVESIKQHVRSHSLPFSGPQGFVRYDKFTISEVKDLLVCFLYILKNISEELITGWWMHSSESDTLDFFHLLELCLHHFRYIGRKHISNRLKQPGDSQSKANTLPARMGPPNFGNGYEGSFSESLTATSSDADCVFRALLEANMATEVGLIALDSLGLYCQHFKDTLLQNDGDNLLMRKVADIYLSFLQVSQSETLLKHLFAALRAFINKFPTALFQGNALLCGRMCFEALLPSHWEQNIASCAWVIQQLLKCCNSQLSTVRNEACALLYLLMRSNFQFTNNKALTRVHLQLIISVSRLLGEVSNLNNARFQESLSVVNNYAASDKGMKRTSFPAEIKDLTKRIRTVLMATLQMKEHENDPEMLIDLQHSLANSYSSTPSLRKTWLENMSDKHKKNGDLTEAAYCNIHIAALEAEYLKHRGVFLDGCHAFSFISPNVLQDECNVKDDSGIHDVQYTEDTLLDRLHICIKLLQEAERYEVIPEVFKIIIPFYEKRRDYKMLAHCYKMLHSICLKINEANSSGKRLLGRYYRVAFFGQEYFQDDSGKEYIYKEPKVTKLSEISQRLQQLFTEKFGKGNIKMIMDSAHFNPAELDPRFAYIQVTHVVPYFDELEITRRPTEFEQNNNVKQFMYETPFTLESNKAQGSPEEQWKKRTILTSMYHFPYVKKRIPVLNKSEQTFSPLEVAIDEMQARVAELQEVVTLKPTDLKKLQLKLQGSISVQVNAGPLAYANAFLGEKSGNYPLEKKEQLKEIYRKFLAVCQDALDMNGRLVTSDQYEYHELLKKNYLGLVEALNEWLEERYDSRASMIVKRSSTEIFDYISGTPGTSTV